MPGGILGVRWRARPVWQPLRRRSWPLPAVLAMLLLTLATAAAATGALDRIAVGRSIGIIYSANAYPFSFRDADGAPRGYSVDLCRRIVASIQSDLGLDALEIRWSEGNTPRRVAAVANGEADLDCGLTSLSLGFQRVVDFSHPVFVESGALLVRRDSGILDLSDLGGKRLGVVPETSAERRLRPLLETRLINAELVPIRDARDGRERLLEGELEAFAGDRTVLLGQLATVLLGQLAGDGEAVTTPELLLLDADLSAEPYAFALPRNDADFRLAVNRALALIYRSREVDRIFRRWFGRDGAPSRLLETIFFIYGAED
ncbi:MAG: amino acid ABC transporter substrate-binding protein [Chromatiaceae bacterium]|nr:MAG: amino acid ABC transporter substrate-binding protein [Chromatiaceae bacterium]